MIRQPRGIAAARAIKILIAGGITAAEAEDRFYSMAGGPRGRLLDRACEELPAERRIAAGHPVYRPRSDYTGGPKA